MRSTRSGVGGTTGKPSVSPLAEPGFGIVRHRKPRHASANDVARQGRKRDGSGQDSMSNRPFSREGLHSGPDEEERRWRSRSPATCAAGVGGGEEELEILYLFCVDRRRPFEVVTGG